MERKIEGMMVFGLFCLIAFVCTIKSWVFDRPFGDEVGVWFQRIAWTIMDILLLVFFILATHG